jgi:hypothetical protein
MRTLGTYFEQVPRTVIEKILAKQDAPAENKIGSNAAVTEPAASKIPNRAKSRNPKP